MGSTKRELPSLKPAGRRAPYQVLQIAHRGGSHGAEDYEPAHLRRIAALGTHLVEIDIRTTMDGHLVVHHDPHVVASGRVIEIGAHPVGDLAALAPGEVRSARSIIRAARQASLGLYVDIKDITRSEVPGLIGLLAAEDMIDRAILASADADTVAHCAVAAPDLPRAVLFRSVDEDPIELAHAARADFLHPCWESESRPGEILAGRWLADVRRNRLGVVCWHEERPDVLGELLALGVDGICTDDPALLAGLAVTSDGGLPPRTT